MAEYVLTEEGKKYLKEGLPEKNLVELLKKGTVDFSEAKKKIYNFPIAIQWVKKKRWADIRAGKLNLLKFPERIEEQEALRRIDEGRDVDQNILRTLLERNLVKKISETFKRTEKELKERGNVIDKLNHDILRTGLWKGKKFSPVDVKTVRAKPPKLPAGNRQPYEDFLMHVRKKLVAMGFKEMTGPTIELEFWNFDALFQPQNHPARNWTSSYSIKFPNFGTLPPEKIVSRVKAAHENGWKTGSTGWEYKWSEKTASKLMPRAHDTAISPRYLAKGVKIPGRYFNMVRCYRPDVIDATHGVEFIQTGGFVVAKDLNFKHLLGLLKEFAYKIAGIKEIKFMTDYYPFTEPSVQISGKHSKLGWIELAGAGIFRPELTEPLGVKEPVIAWGFGIDRLAMNKLSINDIRELFSRNLEWLRSQKT